MAIPNSQIHPLFTQAVVDVYKERPRVTSFLRSFFPSNVSLTKLVSIAVQRGSEKVAVDVKRYSEANHNSFDLSTERIIEPPLYKEKMTANDHRLYDQVILSLSQGNTTFFPQLTAELAEDMQELENVILRAIEVQCANVLETGIVTLTNNTNIDFKRKAASLIANTAGNTWDTPTVDPYKSLEAGAKFIRTAGKAQGGTYTVIMGGDAYSDFVNNPIVQGRADVRNFHFDDLRAPQRDSIGGAFHGQVSAGSYKFNIWTYPEFRDVAGVSTPYVNDKKIIILPENPRFSTQFAAVPQLIEGSTIPQKGEFLIKDYTDVQMTAHTMEIMSAPIAVPTAIDQMYTEQVVA